MVYRRFSNVFPQIKPVNVALLEGTTSHHAPDPKGRSSGVARLLLQSANVSLVWMIQAWVQSGLFMGIT